MDFAAGLVLWAWLVKAIVIVFAAWGVLAPVVGLKVLALLRQQGGQMTDLKSDVEQLAKDAADNKAAFATLAGKVDEALVQLAAAKAASVDPAVTAMLEGAIVTLEGTTASAVAESAKVDAAIAPPPTEPTPSTETPTEPPTAPTEG